MSDTLTKLEISRREHELVQLLREVGSEKSGWATLQTMELPEIQEVQAMLLWQSGRPHAVASFVERLQALEEAYPGPGPS